MAGQTDRAHVRLVELVASLSLGIGLGFGQPLEHVLRHCLISLRVADLIGLGEPERAVVYYTVLLVNVGCHSDAHEQAKWFGDDITLKSGKYDYEIRSLRAAGCSAPPTRIKRCASPVRTARPAPTRTPPRGCGPRWAPVASTPTRCSGRPATASRAVTTEPRDSPSARSRC